MRNIKLIVKILNLRVMKTAILVFVISFSFITILNAQDSLTRKRANPRFWFKLYDEGHKLSVRLYEVKDSSILVSKTSRISDYYSGNFKVNQLNINFIKNIRYRNAHNTIFGIMIGAAAGLAVGAIIGQSEVTTTGWFGSTAQEKANWDMFGCTLMGGCAGAVFSQIKVKISLNGSPTYYTKYKTRLERKSVRYKYLSGK